MFEASKMFKMLLIQEYKLFTSIVKPLINDEGLELYTLKNGFPVNALTPGALRHPSIILSITDDKALE